MVSITLADAGSTGRKPVSILHIASMMDADVAVVKLRFLDALGEVTYYTTPDAMRCASCATTASRPRQRRARSRSWSASNT